MTKQSRYGTTQAAYGTFHTRIYRASSNNVPITSLTHSGPSEIRRGYRLSVYLGKPMTRFMIFVLRDSLLKDIAAYDPSPFERLRKIKKHAHLSNHFVLQENYHRCFFRKLNYCLSSAVCRVTRIEIVASRQPGARLCSLLTHDVKATLASEAFKFREDYISIIMLSINAWDSERGEYVRDLRQVLGGVNMGYIEIIQEPYPTLVSHSS
ncbi:hypothetical protein J1614_002831 [Plenodomus biglobosus]|nr:hypothetical protein J1614_002831 [Plenodomus biglobosus]